MRIVLDTNILVRANPKVSPQALARDLVLTIASGPHVLILSPAILGEVERVLTYPHVQARWPLTGEAIEQYLVFLEAAGSATECGPADNGYCNQSGQGILGTVARDVTGNTITFTFAGAGLIPGQSSVDFVIETNSHTFVSSTTSVFGANSTSASGISGVFSAGGTAAPPTTPAPTPAPSTLPLLVTGLAITAGWSFLRGRRRIRT